VNRVAVQGLIVLVLLILLVLSLLIFSFVGKTIEITRKSKRMRTITNPRRPHTFRSRLSGS